MNYNEMPPNRFTRLVSVKRDRQVFRQISIDSGIVDYEEEPIKANRELDSEDEMSEDEEFEDAEEFDE